MDPIFARSLRTIDRGLEGPLAQCTPGKTHENSEISVKVLVTGGTGFVGSHAVAALLRDGHWVRLLVRDPSKIQRVLKARGIEVDDYAVGDIADAQAVRTAFIGCDAANPVHDRGTGEIVDFLAMHGDLSRGIDSQSHFVAANLVQQTEAAALNGDAVFAVEVLVQS